MSSVQATLDFADDAGGITFTTYKGHCECGHDYECGRCSIALEMSICCEKCGKIIQVGDVIRR